PQDVDGKSWGRPQLEGKIVVLDFWTTWCAPCLKQIPRIRELYDSYSREELVMLGVNLDSGGNRSLRRWLRMNQAKMTWPQLFNRGGFSSALPQCYGIREVPVILVFDRNGRLAHRCDSAEAAAVAVASMMRTEAHATATD
ncbi:MAG TPA: TlpA disulfide reductase family protein, partial [Cyclobacteriaceae bacterium]|nr:TlpA disulfide reductase family protein [Cyclobacteriaceae bacterium]